jgi:S-adenosylmethionine:tRNA ribosyltransferase-isomerase
MQTSDFDYDLPAEMIAQSPVEPRDSSRLLVLDRKTGEIRHVIFRELGNFLLPGDCLVVNETRVIPARLYARKVPTGGKVELLLLRKRGEYCWESLIGGSRVKIGTKLHLLDREGNLYPLGAEVVEQLDEFNRVVCFEKEIEAHLAAVGNVPLPPYIHTTLRDPERYQTVFSRLNGSAAAPTAGLHFTPNLIQELRAAQIKFTSVTLHVGLDTFAPVTEKDPREHRIHTEWCQVSETAVAEILQTQRSGGRIIAVGTTCVRTLEAAARHGVIEPMVGPTDLFILPGYEFKIVQGMITNFHLPRSTLIMLVSAFAGRENVLAAYEIAKKEGYRFYSFGDAMLII